MKGLDRRIVLAAVSLAIIVVYVYYTRVGQPYHAHRIVQQDQIVAGTAEEPYRFRVLMPFLVEGLRRLIALGGASDADAFRSASFLFDVGMISALFVTAAQLLRRYHDDARTLIGVLIMGGFIHVMMQQHWYSPWTFAEAVLFNLFLLRFDRPGPSPGGLALAMGALVAVASLNRETAVVMPGVMALSALVSLRAGDRQAARFLAPAILVSGVAWVVVYGSLRLGLGPGPVQISVPDILRENLSGAGWRQASMNLFLLLGLMWLLLPDALRRAAPPLRRLLLLSLACYVPLILVFGVWYEVRLFMPVYALLVGALLYAFDFGSPSPD